MTMMENQKADLKYWYLRNHKLFTQLNGSDIASLCIISKYKEALKSEIIYFGSETSDRIFILKKGVIKIMASQPDGSTNVKEILQAGDLFGMMPGIPNAGEGDYEEYAQVVSERVSICSFYTKDFEALLEDKPNLSLKYTKVIGLRLKTLQQRYHNLVFKDVRTRLLEFFVSYALDFEGKETEESISVKNFLTHEDISSLIGSSRQTATTLLKQLENEGFVSYSRTEIVINKKKCEAILARMSASRQLTV